MLTVHIDNASGDNAVPDDSEIEKWVAAALKDYSTDVEINIRVVDAEESTQLNGKYRNKYRPTNVLSFPFDLPPNIPSPLLGDLAICAPIVALEAEQQHKSIKAHWAHMVIHGCLHLLGYDHIESNQARLMEELETALMATLGFPDPYECNVSHTTGQQQ